MNNFMISAKRFFTNKNTVTIIGVVIILVILYSGYQSTVKNAVNPVKVPVARVTIYQQTQISSSDIDWVTIQGKLATSNIYMRENEIVGKYTDVGVTIPQGSMFYKSVLVNKEDLPGSWLTLLATDANGVTDKPFYVPVNIVTTYGNSIQPETTIDIYMKARDESNMIMFGKLIENIEILAVKDGSGRDVFTGGGEQTLTPSFLYFGVIEDYHILLKKAQYLTNLGVELIVVPHGGISPMTGDVEVSSEYLRDFIEANTVKIPENSEYIDMEDEFDFNF